jgi:GTP-binding protein
MLIDNATITVKAGNGGNGAVSFRRDAITAKGGPDGGNGGNGGSVYFQGSIHARDLHEFRYKKKLQAEHGQDGMKKNLFGKNAPDIVCYVPLGTTITEKKTGLSWEITSPESKFLVVGGGRGGRGNYEFRSATNRAPLEHELGVKGQVREVVLELTLIADFGLVGLPNAGKSSLLKGLTRARPKTGAYPFTTLEPSLGMLDSHPIADIPGLIAGASRGKGLGVKFLRHIEKTKVLLHCIDATQQNPLEAYETIRKEFSEYNNFLTEKREIILITKTDLVNEDQMHELIHLFVAKSPDVWTCSIYNQNSIKNLKKRLTEVANSFTTD